MDASDGTARSGAAVAAEPGSPGDGSVEATFTVPDMDCPDCALRIGEHLDGVDGVLSCDARPVARRLHVRLDPARTDAGRVRDEVRRLGYHPRVAGAERGSGLDSDRSTVWRGPDALRTWASMALFAPALVLHLVAPGPTLLSLPLADLDVAGALFVLAALVGGWNFFPKGVRSARTLSLDMNFLMTVAIFGAIAVGEYLEAGAIAFLFSLAELLERYSVDRARRSIASLLELAPETALVRRDGEEVRVPAAEVLPGEIVVVRPGQRIPADGRVVEGSSAVDQSAVTGESVPVDRTVGDEVFAGTVNAHGHLAVRVEKAAGDSTLARMIRLVEEAEARKTRSERFVERFARWYTPAVTAGAVAVAVLPPLVGILPFEESFVRGLTLLVIACPCALVISTPVAVVSGITAAARNGVLIEGGVHLETMGEVEVVAFDKTGTLTRGRPELVEVVPAPGSGMAEGEVLALAAAVESRSEHPLGRAVVVAARERGVSWSEAAVEEFTALPGRGARAVVDGSEVVVGRPALFEGLGAASPGGPSSSLRDEIHRLARGGRTVVVVGHGDRPVGLLALADRPREGAAAAVAALRKAGVRRIVMLTGDSEETAAAIAREVGIDEWRAGVLPEEKVRAVEELEAEHGRVAMVGDGVNDAPALAAASVGIAMGAAGSDAAIDTADVALMGDDLGKVAYLYRLSHMGRGVIRQNVTLSVLLKGGLALAVPFGWVSLVAAVVVGDMGASLAVTGNALRVARVRA